MKKKVIVTGGSGKAGRACIRHLLDHGYSVLNVDRAAPAQRLCPTLRADLSDFGQTIGAFAGEPGSAVHAVVHLAAIPAPGICTEAETFRNNMLGDYNVFEACRQLRIRNVVWASSETVLGLPFDEPPPYAPADEAFPPRPESSYSLAKHLTETMAQQFCRRDPQQKIIGLRFSNVMEPQDYRKFPAFDADASVRRWNLWGYIDARDAAQAVRLSIESSLTGAEVFIIANADTVMSRPNEELLKEQFPTVPLKGKIEPNQTLLSIDKARRVLGYHPQHDWRSALKELERVSQ